MQVISMKIIFNYTCSTKINVLRKWDPREDNKIKELNMLQYIRGISITLKPYKENQWIWMWNKLNNILITYYNYINNAKAQ